MVSFDEVWWRWVWVWVCECECECAVVDNAKQLYRECEKHAKICCSARAKIAAPLQPLWFLLNFNPSNVVTAFDLLITILSHLHFFKDSS